MKFEFIDDIKGSWKLLTVHVAAIWAAALGFFLSDPAMFLHAWNSLPDDIKTVFPSWVRWIVGFSAVFGSIYLARTLKQPVRDKTEIIVKEEVKNDKPA